MFEYGIILTMKKVKQHKSYKTFPIRKSTLTKHNNNEDPAKNLRLQKEINELANAIDAFCLFASILCFIIFNVVYWKTYL